MSNEQAVGQIYALMGKIMAEIGHVGKDSKNEQQGFKYRSIDAVYNAINPLLGKYGVFILPEVLSKTREERTNKNGTVLAFTCLRMRYSFMAPDGSHVCCVVEGEGMDSGDKSSNKAMAVAHKYALLQTFCIPTEEAKDPDAEVHVIAESAQPARKDPAPVAEPKAPAHKHLPQPADAPASQEFPPHVGGATITSPQLRILLKALERKGLAEHTLTDAFGIAALNQLPAASINDAIAWVSSQKAEATPERDDDEAGDRI